MCVFFGEQFVSVVLHIVHCIHVHVHVHVCPQNQAVSYAYVHVCTLYMLTAMGKHPQWFLHLYLAICPRLLWPHQRGRLPPEQRWRARWRIYLTPYRMYMFVHLNIFTIVLLFADKVKLEEKHRYESCVLSL